MVNVEGLKLYARIDSADEDELLQQLINGAEAEIRDSTGKGRPTPDDELYDIAVMQLASHWYTNRTPTEVGTIVSAVPYSLQLLTNHIAMSSRYPEVLDESNQ